MFLFLGAEVGEGEGVRHTAVTLDPGSKVHMGLLLRQCQLSGHGCDVYLAIHSKCYYDTLSQ